jgi:(1->4)-alpha-D-glucan 1-alpha-D-glucosylmutase
MSRLRIPSATYRLQFCAGFRFEDARRLVPYLAELGITEVYASPLLTPRAGSPHGYDVIDPLRLNPALGTEEEFGALSAELRAAGMGLILDIVPNHMAATAENPWWRDVLAQGRLSPHASSFDIVWDEPPHRVILPVLGGPYAEVLERGELTPVRVGDGFAVRYYEHEFPLAPWTWDRIFRRGLSALATRVGRQHPAMIDLDRLLQEIEAAAGSREREPGGAGGGARAAAEAVRASVKYLFERHPEMIEHADAALAELAGSPGQPDSFDALDELLDAQPHRLAFWRLASERMNYRRFFDNTDLVGVRVEEPRVLELTHRKIAELIAREQVTGLRVDHIDGLWDPQDYLARLQELAGGPFYVVVEKILSGGERLPASWPIHGTTGYEFGRAVDDMMVDARGLEILNRVYGRFIGGQPEFADLVYARKKEVADRLFGGEMARLTRLLCTLAMEDRYGRDLHWAELEAALRQVSVCLPVYRTYVRNGLVDPHDREVIDEAVAEARRRAPQVSAQAYDYVRRVLLLEGPERYRPRWSHFARRWQQLTSPLTAKGIEDTALYQYNRLLSLNSVGGEPTPDESEMTVAAFHQHNRRELHDWPHGLNSSSTHDSKRSEDVRARLHILSEVTTSFARALPRWRRMNAGFKRPVGDHQAPDHNEEYLFYQTLIGAWPLDPEDLGHLRERLEAYVVKAAREAKVHTSWRQQDPDHEQALVDFVRQALGNAEFLDEFRKFHERVAYFGALGSLSATLLKITAPGVPDFYQGTELWTFTLVDPDNRRPVDFERRIELLAALRGAPDPRLLARELLASWPDGRIKMFLIHRALAARNRLRDVFDRGDHLPLTVAGHRNKNLCAFARRAGDRWSLTAVPVRIARFASPDRPPLGKRIWKTTSIRLPDDAPEQWTDELTGVTVRARDRILDVHKLFTTLPLFLGTGG